MPDRLKIAIVGCGAVTKRSHLPALQRLNELVEVKALVDLNRNMTKDLAEIYSVPIVTSDINKVLEMVDAVIIALPHHLHAEYGVHCLNNGKHVLIEKPLALDITQCDKLIDAADSVKCVLAVAMVRRWLHSAQLGKSILDSGILGKIEEVNIEEGTIYGWPVASDFFFKRETAGGGVLMDTGAHVIDLLLWWFGEPSVVKYFDDSAGGVEADCTVELKLSNQAACFMKLSRIRQLRNTIQVQGEKACMEVSLLGNSIDLQITDSKASLKGLATTDDDKNKQTTIDLFVAQLWDWITAITNNKKPMADGEEAKRTIQVIQSCYAVKKYCQPAWAQFDNFVEKVNIDLA